MGDHRKGEAGAFYELPYFERGNGTTFQVGAGKDEGSKQSAERHLRMLFYPDVLYLLACCMKTCNTGWNVTIFVN